MPREARKRSSTGIYHIMLRGIDKRNIFLDDQDREKFIEKIRKAYTSESSKSYNCRCS
ncbi:MAG: hypothetical protein ACLFMO_07985 [Eubacteriales bacterium]